MQSLFFYDPIALLDRSSTLIIGFRYKAFAIADPDLSCNRIEFYLLESSNAYINILMILFSIKS